MSARVVERRQGLLRGWLAAASLPLGVACIACGGGDDPTRASAVLDGGPDAAPLASLDAGAEAADALAEASAPEVDANAVEAHTDAASPIDTAVDAAPACDAGEGGLPSASRFVTRVVDFSPGACAGFGASSFPGVVEGPPRGAGSSQGSTDVLSLGTSGSITLSFEPNAIVDGPGPDFLVFENPFAIGGELGDPNAEPAEVSVSDDGATWLTFPCTATAYPYGSCAGWHVVYSNPANCISPVDPSAAGGDPFDLHEVGLTHARYVRITDRTGEACAGFTTNGFDLDAVSVVNAEAP